VAIYHNLLPRIMHTNSPILEVIRTCEQDFFKDEGELPKATASFPLLTASFQQAGDRKEEKELDVDEVLEEVERLLRRGRD